MGKNTQEAKPLAKRKLKKAFLY